MTIPMNSVILQVILTATGCAESPRCATAAVVEFPANSAQKVDDLLSTTSGTVVISLSVQTEILGLTRVGLRAIFLIDMIALTGEAGNHLGKNRHGTKLPIIELCVVAWAPHPSLTLCWSIWYCPTNQTESHNC